jgi:hypothetical protein
MHKKLVGSIILVSIGGCFGPVGPVGSIGPIGSIGPNPATFAFALEPAKPKENLNQQASDAVKDLGTNMNKAGAAIKKTMDGAEEKVKEAGRSTAAATKNAAGKMSGKKSGKASDSKAAGGAGNVGDQLEAGAKNALNNVEAGADKAEHAIVNGVKGMSKPAGTKGGASKSSDKNGGPSIGESLQEFGRNAEKAGTAMENGVKKMGAQAGKQIGKADQAIKQKTQHK